MTKEIIDKFSAKYDDLRKRGNKLQMYWTIGHFNFVTIMEAPSEKEAMELLVPFADVAEVEALTAIPRDEAIKVL